MRACVRACVCVCVCVCVGGGGGGCLLVLLCTIGLCSSQIIYTLVSILVIHPEYEDLQPTLLRYS